MKRRAFLTSAARSGLGVGLGLLPALGTPRQFPTQDLRPFQPSAGEPDERVFARARREFLFPTSVTYCNTGTLGASPREVVRAQNLGLDQLERDLPDWPYFQADGEPLTGYQQLREIRASVGAFINAAADDIAIVQNATTGMSCLANGLDLAEGDEILTTDQEHSGGVGSWRLRAKRHGVVVRELPLAKALADGPAGVLALFDRALTARTRVVMFSHITSGLGVLLPAKDICQMARRHGALAIVDGAQAVGQRRVDVQDLECDAYVTSPHKWLLAPKGTGVLYIRRDVQSRVWSTLASGNFDNQTVGAFRFMQYGTGSVPVVQGLSAAVAFVSRIGIERIERWDAMLTRRLRDGLAAIPAARLSSPADPRLASALTTFGVRGRSGRELQDALWEKKIRVRAQGTSERVRLSAHLYVGPADIDRALDVVSALGR